MLIERKHKGRLHYASVERGNESNPNDEWSKTACGLELESGLTDKWEWVTCKNCLIRRVGKKKFKEIFS